MKITSQAGLSEDYTSEKDVIDSFDDGFKLKSLILAQNERWRQA